MKMVLLLLAVVFCGCATVQKGEVLRYEKKMILAKSKSAIYRVLPDRGVGESIGTMQAQAEDTVTTTAEYVVSGGNGSYYMIIVNGAEVYVSDRDLESLYWNTVKRQPNPFDVDKADDERAWGRANYYVSKNSDMKIQTATNFLIETYNPIRGSQKGYKITRTPKGDKVEYEVTITRADGLIGTERDEKECAYYILTGIEY